MNKIYKVIYNHALGIFQAVTELAKGHVKSSRQCEQKTNKASATTGCFKLKPLSLMLALLIPSMVFAAPATRNGYDKGDFSALVIGEQNDTAGQDGAASAYSGASSDNPNLMPANHHSIAIGGSAKVDNNKWSTALGYKANAEAKNGSKDGSIALGAFSSTKAANTGTGSQSIEISGKTYEFAGKANRNTSVLSIGAGTTVQEPTGRANGRGTYYDTYTSSQNYQYRQIQNVAAGTISATSTDAVNGSQLFALASAINDLNKGGDGGTKVDVKGGTNIASVQKTETDGQTVYTVNADGAKVSKGSDAVTVTNGKKDATTNITDYKIDLSDATKTTLSQVNTNKTNIEGNKTSITKNTTDIKALQDNTVKLGGDTNTVTTEPQKLSKSGGLQFNIVGDSKYVTTAASGTNVKVSVKEEAIKETAKTVATEVKSDNKSVTIKKTTGANGQSIYDLSVSVAATASDLAYKANGKNAKSVSLANGLDFTDTTNITATVDENGVVKHTLKDNITVKNVTADNMTVNNTPTNNTSVTNKKYVDDSISAVNLKTKGNTGEGAVNLATQALDVTATGTNGVSARTVANATGIVVNVDASELKTAIDKNKTDISTNTTDITKLKDNTIKLGGDNATMTNAQKLSNDGGLKFNVVGDDKFVTTTASGTDVKVAVKEDAIKNTAKTVTTKVTSKNKSVTISETQDGDRTVYDLSVDASGTTLNYKADGKNAQAVNLSDGLNFTSTDNITSTVDANGVVKHALKDDITVKNVTADNMTVNNAPTDNTSVTNKKYVDESVAAAKTEVKAGNNVTVDADTTSAKDGHTIYTVNAKATTAKAGSEAVTVEGTTNATDVTDYVVDLSKKTKDTLVKAEKGFNIDADNKTPDNVQLGETVTYNGDKNITTKVTNNNIAITLNDAINVSTVTANTIKAGDVNATNMTVTNAPTTDNSVTNKSYVDGEVAKVTLNTAGDTGTGSVKLADQTFAVKANAIGKIAANTVANAQGITINVDSTAIDNAIADNTKNITNNTNNITTLQNNTIKLGGDKGTTETQALNKSGGLKFDVKGDNKYITTSATGDAVTISVDESAVKKTAKSVTTEVKSDNNSVTVTQTTGANGQSVYDLSVDTSGTNLAYKADGQNNQSVTLAKGLDFTSTGNITATVDANGVVKHTLKDDITVNNITANDMTVKNAPTTNNSVTNKSYVDGEVAKVTLKTAGDSGKGSVNLANQTLKVDTKTTGKISANTVANEQGITINVDSTALDNEITKNTTNIDALKDNTIKLGGDTGATDGQALSKKDGLQFNVVGDNKYVTTEASGTNVKVAVKEDAIKDTAKTVTSKITSNNKSVTVNETKEGDRTVYDLSVDASGTNLAYKADGKNDQSVTLAKGLDFMSTENITATVDKDGVVKHTLNDDIKIGKDGADGKDGTIGVNGKDGASVVLNGKDGSIGLTGPRGKDGANGKSANISVQDGQPGVDGAAGLDGRDGTDGKTRIVYETKDKNNNTVKEEIATLNDGLRFTGNNVSTENKHKLNSLVKVQGEGVTEEMSKTFNSATGNINVVADGNNTLTVQLAKDLQNLNSVTLVNKTDPAKSTTISSDKDGNLDVGGDKITNVAKGEISKDSTDAINGSQLHEVKEIANKGFNIDADKRANGVTNADNVAPGETVKFTSKDGNVITTIDGENNVDFGLNNTINVGGKDGKDGAIGVKGADGKDGITIKPDAIVFNGVNGKDGQSAISVNGKNGANGLDGTSITRIEYTDPNTNKTEIVATLNDGLNFTGNNEVNNAHKLNSKVKIIGEGVDKAASEKFASASGNINVKANGTDTLEVQLNKDLKNLNSVTLVNKDDPTKSTTITSNTDGNLDVGGDKITNVSDGEIAENSKDAINGSQLYKVKTELTTDAFGLKDQNGNEFKQSLGTTAQIVGNDNISTKVITKDDGSKALEVSLNDNIQIGKNGKDGKDGSIGVNGKDGASVTLNGKDGSIGLTGPRGANGKDGASANISVQNGAKGLDGNDGENGESKTRIVYKKSDGKTETIATLNDGLNFQGDTGEVIAKKLNETLSIKGNVDANADVTDKNLRVDNVKGELILKMAKNLTDLTSITVGGTVINNDGLSITNGPSVKNTGIDAGNKKIINVSDGEIAENSKDAINGSQLHKVKTELTTNAFGLKDQDGNEFKQNLGSTAQIVGNDNISTKVITKNDGSKALEVSLNDNIQIGKDGKDGKDGSIGVKGKDGASVTLNGKDGSIGLTGPRGTDGKDGASADISVQNGAKGLDGNDGENGESKTRIVYKKTDGTTETIATLNDGLKFQGDTGDVIAKKLNETLLIKGNLDSKAEVTDKNLRVDSVNGELILKMAKNLTDLTSITVGDTFINNDGLTITGGPSVTKAGINAGNKVISNVKEGVDGNDAVNVNQLNDVKNIANKGWNLTTNGDSASKSNVKPGDSVDFANKDGNIKITNDGNNLTVDLAKNLNLGEDGSVEIGDTKLDGNGLVINGGPSVTKQGLDAGSKKITNVQAGEADTDAVNVSQLNDATNKVKDAVTWKVNTEGQSDAKKEAQSVSNQTVTVKHGVNTQVSEIKKDENGNYSYEINVTGLPMEYIDEAGNTLVNIGGQFYSQKDGGNGQKILTPSTPAKVRITSEKPMQLTNVADGKISEDSTDAINGSQLNKVITDGLTFAGDNGEFKTPLGKKVTISGGVKEAAKLTDNNIGVVAENGTLNVKLAKALTGLTSAEFKDDNGNVTNVNGNGISIAGNNGKTISLTADGLNNGGNRITNVAPGVDGTDAVNVNQLRGIANHIAGKINKVDNNARAGIAGAIATATLPQAYLPGKSLVAVGGGTYRGESGVALGMSTISDGGNWILKTTANADSRGNFGAGAAIGYQW
ncbi:trimeric autotransporter adhesin [Cricetibacter osteomyelitidis]|uniref:Trimeric autotransporter adhesin n=1 Tax=Cricetibacter osteomyelitidis TaxID=1521931 RepID=A0A4R2SMH7_9PAST|nr:YadA-like family protein [Cricetibacter osteomyelitidis]TCP91227.1 trimeric autotransporter adhesin [Cricetibacter osteomyelitidis]